MGHRMKCHGTPSGVEDACRDDDPGKPFGYGEKSNTRDRPNVRISGGFGGLCSGSQARRLCVLIVKLVKARVEHVTYANPLAHGETPRAIKPTYPYGYYTVNQTCARRNVNKDD
jgi:hypothetical protein